MIDMAQTILEFLGGLLIVGFGIWLLIVIIGTIRVTWEAFKAHEDKICKAILGGFVGFLGLFAIGGLLSNLL